MSRFHAGGTIPINKNLYDKYSHKYGSEYKFIETEDMLDGNMYYIEKIESETQVRKPGIKKE